MASATLETTIALEASKAVEDAFERDEELSENDVHTAILIGNFIQTLFQETRKSIENSMRQGVSAKAFAIKCGHAVVTLDNVKGAVSRVLAKVKGNRLLARREELISTYEALDSDLANLRQFLREVQEKIEKPSRPIDWQHVREVEEAHVRGETKPYRKITAGHNGS